MLLSICFNQAEIHPACKQGLFAGAPCNPEYQTTSNEALSLKQCGIIKLLFGNSIQGRGRNLKAAKALFGSWAATENN